MKVAELLERRRGNWRDLEQLCARLETGTRKISGADAARFASLYRAACADLALADAYQLPPNTVSFLHQLVGRAHNQLYRTQSFDLSKWWEVLFVELPQRLYRDNYLRVAFVLFWGVFLSCLCLGYASDRFAQSAVGQAALDRMEEMYSEKITTRGANADALMVSFYIQHNTSIGLQCFACGMLLGIGGLFVVVDNAVQLGSIFGHMATTPQKEAFFQFVTAHGPFELTAIVVSAAAGMRLGFSLVDTGGYSRVDSLKRAAAEAMPVAGLAMLLFTLAALIEGIVSPSPLPYWAKATVAVACSAALAFYFLMLGQRTGERLAN